jgi:hypothetical protein
MLPLPIIVSNNPMPRRIWMRSQLELPTRPVGVAPYGQNVLSPNDVVVKDKIAKSTFLVSLAKLTLEKSCR